MKTKLSNEVEFIYTEPYGNCTAIKLNGAMLYEVQNAKFEVGPAELHQVTLTLNAHVKTTAISEEEWKALE